MSIHLASMVWRTELGGPSFKAVAMKLADCADDDGTSIFPSVSRIAREAELSPRTVQYALKALREMGIIKVVEAGGDGPGSTNVYEIDVAVLTKRMAATQAKWKAQDQEEKGAKFAPFPRARKGAKSANKGAAVARKGAAVAPNPSLPVIEPSITPLPPDGGERQTASRTGRKQGQFTAEQIKLTDNAFALWNEIAPTVNGQRLKAITSARRRRMLLRLDDIGGLDQFAVALSAIERVPFLMGKVAPRPGQAPFKLDIDRLLQTEGKLGDVLAKLIDKAGDDSELVGPNGKRWGWWRGKEADYRAMSLDTWRSIDAANKPNGTWPWWAMGPPPGNADCLVPPELVAERGYAEIYRGNITANGGNRAAGK